MNYLFLSSATLALMLLVFKLTMSHTTFHRFNRVVLLTILVLSAILPLAQFDLVGQRVMNYYTEIEKPDEEPVSQIIIPAEPILLEYADTYVPNQSEVVQSVEQTKIMHPIEILTLVYFAGLILFLSNLIIRIIQTEIICHKRGRYLSDGTKLVLLPNDFSPFSWRRCIVMSETDYNRDGKAIEIHELAHVHNHHTLDLILAQICCSVQWFNPASWALLHCLKEQHEFEADSAVLQHGIQAKEYQICLLRATLVHKVVLTANNFADCSTKKRINMMNEKTTLPLARLRVLFMLPIIFIIIAVASGCNSKNSNNQLPENSTAIEQVEPVATTVEEPIITDTLEYLFGDKNKDIKIKESFVKDKEKCLLIIITDENKIIANDQNISLTDLRSMIHSWYPNGTDSITPIVDYSTFNKKQMVDVLKILKSEFKKESILLKLPTLPPPHAPLIIADTIDYLFKYGIEYMKATKYLNDGRHIKFNVIVNRNNEIMVNNKATNITELKSMIHESFPNGTGSGLALLSFDLGASPTFLFDVFKILKSEFVSCFTIKPTVVDVIVIDEKKK